MPRWLLTALFLTLVALSVVGLVTLSQVAELGESRLALVAISGAEMLLVVLLFAVMRRLRKR